MHLVDTSDPAARTVGAVLRAQAAAVGDAVFLRSGDRSMTFVEVDTEANRLAAGFAGLGVGRGDTVSLSMGNSIDFVLTALALNRLGAVWVPTNTAYKGDWLRHTLDAGRADVLVADSAYLETLDRLGSLPFKHVVVRGPAVPGQVAGVDCRPFDGLATGGGGEPASGAEYRDLASVMWTSGTTGRSKGVMQSHSCWLECTQIYNRARDVQPGDVFYCPLPLFNSGGWVINVFAGLVSGLPVAIDPSFSVTDFWARCRFYGATQVVTLGAMHMFLWQAPAAADDAENPVRVAGMIPLPADLIGPMRERFGLDYIWQGFGQSEAMPVTITTRDRPWKEGSAGFPRDDVDLAILDDDDEPVPVGQAGEICVRPRRPDVLFSGYFRDPEATLASMRNLWYHTGDLGRLDEDGELFFVDRKADYIRFKGRNVSSFEVEQVLLTHPAVELAAAHGVASDQLAAEAEIKVCVVLRPGAETSPEELARHVNDHAPYYLVPRYIEFVDDLPRTPTGRVQKFLLRERGVTSGTWDRDQHAFQVQR